MRFFAALAAAAVLAATPAFAKDWVAKPFTLRTTEGKSVSLADYKGKTVVVEFFASWCGVCAASVPEINALAKRYPGQLEVVAIATAEDDPHGLEEFIDEHKPEYTILVDDTDRVARAYDVLVFPTYFLIDQNGVVQSFRRGVVEWENPKVKAFVESVIAGAPLPVTAPAPTFAPAVTTVSR